MADLSGKVAVVSGAGHGVGKGVAEGLAEAGATIYVTGSDSGSAGSGADASAPDSILGTARRVDELGGKAVAVQIDYHDDDQVRAFFERVREEQGRLDVLVNGVFGMSDPAGCGRSFWERSVSAWDDACGLGLRGGYLASACAAPIMVASRRGLIVNVCSDGGGEGAFGTACAVYRAGLDRMAEAMAAELGAYDVAALSLRPGIVKTGFVLQAVASGALALDLDQAESPRFTGRCVAALAMDPDIMEKTGGVYRVAELAREYRFTHPRPPLP